MRRCEELQVARTATREGTFVGTVRGVVRARRRARKTSPVSIGMALEGGSCPPAGAAVTLLIETRSRVSVQ